METQAAKFEGWALIELFGHGREAGFVTTQYFGDKAMFQVDVPELPERDTVLAAPQWIDFDQASKLAPVGSTIRKEAVSGRTRLINPGAVYAMNPATEEAVRTALESAVRRRIISLALPERSQLPLAIDTEAFLADGEPAHDPRGDGAEDDE